MPTPVTPRISITIDCNDIERMADFWQQVLGFTDDGGDGHYRWISAKDGTQPSIILQRVPEARTEKNRIHLDLQVPHIEVEAARIVALGATRIDETPIAEVGYRWIRLADLEGNEFCVVETP
ncbi:MAG: VOC family protein [Actinomycetes bacterium]